MLLGGSGGGVGTVVTLPYEYEVCVCVCVCSLEDLQNHCSSRIMYLTPSSYREP